MILGVRRFEVMYAVHNKKEVTINMLRDCGVEVPDDPHNQQLVEIIDSVKHTNQKFNDRFINFSLWGKFPRGCRCGCCY